MQLCHRTRWMLALLGDRSRALGISQLNLIMLDTHKKFRAHEEVIDPKVGQVLSTIRRELDVAWRM